MKREVELSILKELMRQLDEKRNVLGTDTMFRIDDPRDCDVLFELTTPGATALRHLWRSRVQACHNSSRQTAAGPPRGRTWACQCLSGTRWRALTLPN